MEFSLDFFGALRRMKARKASAVDAQAQAETDQTGQTDRSPTAAMPPAVGSAGIALIQQFEGCERRRADGRFEAYPDPGTGGDPWTIGWGATGTGIGPGTVWTKAECDSRLERDLELYARDVRRVLGDAPTSPNQFDALVSFHYNTGAIAKATLTRLHKAGEFKAAAQEFGKWVHSGGRRMNGLVRRRRAEMELYCRR